MEIIRLCQMTLNTWRFSGGGAIGHQTWIGKLQTYRGQKRPGIICNLLLISFYVHIWFIRKFSWQFFFFFLENVRLSPFSKPFWPLSLSRPEAVCRCDGITWNTAFIFFPHSSAESFQWLRPSPARNFEERGVKPDCWDAKKRCRRITELAFRLVVKKEIKEGNEISQGKGGKYRHVPKSIHMKYMKLV